GCRACRDVDRACCAVPRSGFCSLDRARGRGPERTRFAVQHPPVRFHARVAVCVRRGRDRRHGAARKDFGRRAAAANRGQCAANMTTIALSERPRILVVVLRRLGDVLLATPLIRSLRRAFPRATIDALVYRGTEGVLSGNPDLDAAIAMPAHPTIAESFTMVRRLWRTYDLAV